MYKSARVFKTGMGRVRKKAEARGFTLVEVLVSMVVIVVGILAVLLTNTYVQKAGQLAYERVVATQDAHRVLELMRRTSSTGNFPTNVTSEFPANVPVPGIGDLAAEQLLVSYADPLADPLDVTVTATWKEHGIRDVSTQLRALMTQRKQ